MFYTKENLLDFNLKQLTDIIISLQSQVEVLQSDLRRRMSFDRKLDDLIKEYNSLKDVDSLDGTTLELPTMNTRKRGRRAYTPEEKAASYQRQLDRQREKYYAKKKEKEEENNIQ